MWAKATAEDRSIFACLSLSNQVRRGCQNVSQTMSWVTTLLREGARMTASEKEAFLSNSLLCILTDIEFSEVVGYQLSLGCQDIRLVEEGLVLILLGKMFQDSNVPRLKCAKTPNSQKTFAILSHGLFARSTLLRMPKHLRYKGLGTLPFPICPEQG